MTGDGTGDCFLTDHQQRSIFALVRRFDADAPRLTREQFLSEWGTDDGPGLGRRLLAEAVGRRDAVAVECALLVCAVFDAAVDLETLTVLAHADWHYKHEDVAWELDGLRDPAAGPALCHLAWWVPGYLDFDDTRALARKAIHGLARIPGVEVEVMLAELLATGDEVVREQAQKALRRREAPPSRS